MLCCPGLCELVQNCRFSPWSPFNLSSFALSSFALTCVAGSVLQLMLDSFKG